MRSLLLSLVVVGFLAACGSSGGGDDVGGLDLGPTDVPVADGADVGFLDEQADDAAGDAAPPDTVNPDDVPDDPGQVDDAAVDATDDTLDDTGPGDVAPETGDVTPETIGPYSWAYVQSVCSKACDRVIECASYATTHEGCLADCRDAIAADPDKARTYSCFTMSDDCAAYTPCQEALIPDAEACAETCAAATDCGFYPNEMLGAEPIECEVQCSSFTFVAAGTEKAQILVCIHEAITICDALAMYACVDNGSDGTCPELCASLDTCQNLPGLFDDTAACLTACDAYAEGPALAAMACASMGTDEGETPEPEACAAQAACFPPPAEMVPGTEPFCTALLAKCAGQPGFEIPNDLGVCGWLLSGVVVQMPGADLVNGVACVEAKPDCSAPDTVLGCLLPTYAPCAGVCETADACMPEPKPEKWPGVEGCTSWCSMAHAQDPTAIDQMVQCVTLSADCETTMACLPNDQ
jgi:hypothetical protein